MHGEVQKRIRTLVTRAAEDLGVKIFNGVVSSDHIHLFCSIPPKVKVSDFVQKAKGMSSRKIQEEFPQLKQRYWGSRFWARGYFSTTSGNVSDEVIAEYINNHTEASKNNSEDNITLE